MAKSVDSKNCDVAIVGGGPAGSSLAIRLAMGGFSVVLVEKQKFPREKLCGEFISPECLAHFAELGVLPEISAAGAANLIETVFFSSSGRGVSVPSEWFGNSGATALGLSRAEMDLRLLQRAQSLGVKVFEEASVSRLITNDDGIRGINIKLNERNQIEILAAIIVDATGRKRTIARQFDAASPSKKPATLVAFKTHLRGVDLKPGACEIYAYRGGYGGCNRVENDMYDLCFIASAADTKRLESDAGRVMREVVFTNIRAKQAMQNSVVAKPWLAVPVERFGRGELVPAGGLITVGDAAAFIDPFTGSGILLALESSRIAADALGNHFGDFEKMAAVYKANYAKVFERRLKVCSLLRHAAFVPFLAGVTISLLGVSESVRRRIARATRFSAVPGV